MRRRLFISVIIGGAIVGGWIAVSGWMDQPAVVTRSSSGEPTLDAPASTPLRDIDSQYFSTKVPAEMKVTTHQGANKNVLERYVIGAPYPDGDQVAITIGTMPAGGLSEISDVRLRLQRPELYAKDTSPYVSDGALAFTQQQDIYEHTIFMVHDTRYAALVVTGRPDRTTSLQETFSTAIASWQWK